MSWRDQLHAARQRVHDTFRVRAVYMRQPNAAGRVIHVRLKQKPVEVQMQEGGALMHAVDMNLLFDRAEVSRPTSGAFVLVSPTEGYRVLAAMPPYLGTITATVSPLPDAECATLWAAGVPEDF